MCAIGGYKRLNGNKVVNKKADAYLRQWTNDNYVD